MKHVDVLKQDTVCLDITWTPSGLVIQTLMPKFTNEHISTFKECFITKIPSYYMLEYNPVNSWLCKH